MGRITLGDVAVSGILTVALVLAIAVASVLITSVVFPLSDTASFEVFVCALVAVFIVGGLALGGRSHAAGFPVVRIWAFSAGLLLLVFYMPYFMYGLASGRGISLEIIAGLAVYVCLLFLGIFFVVALAGFLNSRLLTTPQPRSFGTRPGQFGAFIYRSNQPVIYEGIRELDATDEAPGSLYRQKQ